MRIKSDSPLQTDKSYRTQKRRNKTPDQPRSDTNQSSPEPGKLSLK